jgi:hypothetical protein
LQENIQEKKMKKLLLGLTVIVSLFFAAIIAQANTYTFQSNDGAGKQTDMMDLDHNYYYGWGISNNASQQLASDLQKGFVITSAELVYKNIWDWVNEPNDQLATFLLASPPLMPGRETVPVVINGVPQGYNLYTYTRTTISTAQNRTGNAPFGYTFKEKIGNVYYYTKTTISTRTSTNATLPSGYTLSYTTFIPKMVTMQAGIPLSNNLWERYDGQSIADVDWGVPSTLIWDAGTGTNRPTPNPWNDPAGGAAAGSINLTYTFDNTLNTSLDEPDSLIGILTAYALNGSFGFGIDPDCHYYNDGITFTVTTEPVPEPTTILLLGLGLVGLAGIRRKFQN